MKESALKSVALTFTPLESARIEAASVHVGQKGVTGILEWALRRHLKGWWGLMNLDWLNQVFELGLFNAESARALVFREVQKIERAQVPPWMQ